MKHDTKDTSIAALLRPSTQTSHGSLAHRVIDTLTAYGAATRQELAGHLDRQVGSLCAPIKALLKAGLIVETERILNPSTGSWNWKLGLKETHESK